MKIIVEYESSWRNSFLDGSNNEPVPKKGRSFVGSMTKLGKEENYKSREITLDTVLGVLNRLIGDQRKLYQTKQGYADHKDYFAEFVSAIRFEDKPKVLNQEIAYIRNMSGNTDQNTFTGMINVDDPAFQSDFSPEFWGVLSIDFDSLCEFVLEGKGVDVDVALNPISILGRLEKIKKMKPIENSGKAKLVSEKLASNFDKFKSLDNKGNLKLLPIYCSSLYLQLCRLEKKFDLSSIKGARGGIQGISHNQHTPKNFMERYVTGGQKILYGNPYVREEFVKGEGKIKHTLTKASGELDIYLNINMDRAIELKKLIDCAGVSSFYLGKKGLAYVSHIDVR